MELIGDLAGGCGEDGNQQEEDDEETGDEGNEARADHMEIGSAGDRGYLSHRLSHRDVSSMRWNRRSP